MSRVVTFILTISLHLNIAATKREDLESVSIKIGGVPIVIPDFQVGPPANKARGDSSKYILHNLRYGNLHLEY